MTNSKKRKYSVIAVIPARLASVRLPEKMLADLDGRPLIVVTAQRALASGLFDEVIVATDSQKIVDEIQKYSLNVVLTPTELPSGTARVAEVAKNKQADVFVNIQGDEPLIDLHGLASLIKVFEQTDVEMATLWFPLSLEDENNPNVVKLVTNNLENAMYFSRSIIPYPRSYELFAPKKHIGVYAYRKDTLLNLQKLPPTDLEKIESLEQLRALYYGINIRVVKAEADSIGVDTFADLEKVRNIINKSAS